jgi:hypothetical protein
MESERLGERVARGYGWGGDGMGGDGMCGKGWSTGDWRLGVSGQGSG